MAGQCLPAVSVEVIVDSVFFSCYSDSVDVRCECYCQVYACHGPGKIFVNTALVISSVCYKL